MKAFLPCFIVLEDYSRAFLSCQAFFCIILVSGAKLFSKLFFSGTILVGIADIKVLRQIFIAITIRVFFRCIRPLLLNIRKNRLPKQDRRFIYFIKPDGFAFLHQDLLCRFPPERHGALQRNQRQPSGTLRKTIRPPPAVSTEHTPF